MRIFNQSKLPIDKSFWANVSDLLGIEEIRGNQKTGKRNELTVIVDIQKRRDGEKNSLYGRHTKSKILIFPCRDCTRGTVLVTFLHEIMHEWIFWHRPELYDQDWTEDFCEGMARTIFQRVGGKISSENTCRRFQIELPIDPIEQQIEVVQLLTGLTAMSPDQLRDFGLDPHWQRQD